MNEKLKGSNWSKLELPSQFKPYDNINPEECMIRTLIGADEQRLAEINSSNFDEKLNDFLSHVISGIDPKNLTLGDRLYILVWLTINSRSPFLTMTIPCSNCGFEMKNEKVDLSKFEVKGLPEDFKEPIDITLSTGDTVQVRLLRVLDEIENNRFESRKGPSFLYRYARTLVGDKFKNTIEAYTFIQNLPVKDVDYIRYIQDQYFHGPVMESDYKCDVCSYEGVVEVPFSIGFLFVYGDGLKDFIRDQIQSSVSSTHESSRLPSDAAERDLLDARQIS